MPWMMPLPPSVTFPSVEDMPGMRPTPYRAGLAVFKAPVKADGSLAGDYREAQALLEDSS
jgi:hypothetical protein